MSGKQRSSNEVSVDEQGFGRIADAGSEDDGVEVVEDRPEFRPTVQQEKQAKVDANHPDARVEGMTLAAEERFRAEQWEIARTRFRFDNRPGSDREARTRRVAADGSQERRQEFQRRAGSVDRWKDPDQSDPRETLDPEELGQVNRAADRAAEQTRGRSRAALARRMARQVADGADVVTATLETVDETETARGTVVPIGQLDEVYRQEVSVEGAVEALWDDTHPAIQQVGLIADDTGRTKFTVWVKSRKKLVREGERLRIRGGKLHRYDGRPSVAVAGDTRLVTPERE